VYGARCAAGTRQSAMTRSNGEWWMVSGEWVTSITILLYGDASLIESLSQVDNDGLSYIRTSIDIWLKIVQHDWFATAGSAAIHTEIGDWILIMQVEETLLFVENVSCMMASLFNSITYQSFEEFGNARQLSEMISNWIPASFNFSIVIFSLPGRNRRNKSGCKKNDSQNFHDQFFTQFIVPWKDIENWLLTIEYEYFSSIFKPAFHPFRPQLFQYLIWTIRTKKQPAIILPLPTFPFRPYLIEKNNNTMTNRFPVFEPYFYQRKKISSEKKQRLFPLYCFKTAVAVLIYEW